MTKAEITKTIRKILTEKYSVPEEELTEENDLSKYLDYDTQCCLIISIEDTLSTSFTVSNLDKLYTLFTLKALTDIAYANQM